MKTKRNFQDIGDPSDEWFLPVAGARNDQAAGIEDGNIRVSVDDLKRVFEPAISEIIKLVQSQIRGVKGFDNQVRAVVLVGGFGESRYLRQRLKDAIAPVDLLCPLNQ